MLFLSLAWRNIWRNRRRTLITLASILFAVLFASFMESLQKGAWNHMINSVVNYYFGYAQVHQQGYWNDRTLDKAFPLADSLEAITRQLPRVKNVLPRIESFALAAGETATAGVLVTGIDPRPEDAMTQLRSRVSRGTYFTDDDKAALVAEGVAERLNLQVGDTLVLISQGFRGVNAAGKYPIRGLVHFPSPDLNKQLVFLPLAEAQWFYGAEGRVTTLALHLDDQDDIGPALAELRSELDTEAYEVLDWKELMPDLLEAKALDSAGNVIVYFILYLIIAFGLFGTILMMTKEREFEFGILVSIGMHRRQLAAVLWLEIILMGLIGALLGILVSFPVVYYFHVNPIQFTGEYAGLLEQYGFPPEFPAEVNLWVFSTQALVVFLITVLLSIYPISKVMRLKPVEAMRNG